MCNDLAVECTESASHPADWSVACRPSSCQRWRLPAIGGELATARIAGCGTVVVRHLAGDRVRRPSSSDSSSSVNVSIVSSIPGGSMKALLIDDHPLVLSGLQIVIQGFGDDVNVACVETARGAPRAPGRGRQLRHRAARPSAWRLQRLRAARRAAGGVSLAVGRRRLLLRLERRRLASDLPRRHGLHSRSGPATRPCSRR